MEAWKHIAVGRLRDYQNICTAKQQVEQALSALSPEERTILQMMDICPKRGNTEKLCNMLDCETSTIYRWRNSALCKVYHQLYGK